MILVFSSVRWNSIRKLQDWQRDLEKEARETVSFMDFVGIMLNAACWKQNIGALPHGMKYYTLISADKLENEQCRRSNLDFVKLPYDKVYEAGEDNYIEATDAYKALAQFIMKEHGYDVLKAADVVGEILILLQNGNAMKDVVEYLEELGLMADDRKAKAMVPLLMDFNNSTHLWPLKGHTPGELMGESKGKVVPFGQHKAKAKRNDPCPLEGLHELITDLPQKDIPHLLLGVVKVGHHEDIRLRIIFRERSHGRPHKITSPIGELVDQVLLRSKLRVRIDPYLDPSFCPLMHHAGKEVRALRRGIVVGLILRIDKDKFRDRIGILFRERRMDIRACPVSRTFRVSGRRTVCLLRRILPSVCL